MDFVILFGRNLMVAGIAYPAFAKAKRWPVGAATGGSLWAIWFGVGALGYIAAMFVRWNWLGLIAALPTGCIGGMLITFLFRRHVQLIAYLGPVLITA